MEFPQVDKVSQKLEQQFIKEVTLSYKETLADIKARIGVIYERYGVDGKLDMATMQKMAVRDGKELSRLNKLYAVIDEDLASLNRGQPQHMAKYLTDVYEVNHDGVGEAIGNVTGVTFENINRQAVYQSRISELSNLGLRGNAIAGKNEIRRSITTSIVQGESIQKMGKRIQANLEKNATNAITIARTETTRAMGEARQQTFKEAEDMGIEIQKRWLSTSDSRTRDSHRALNNEIVDNDDKFSNGLEYPGDQRGPASEVVNCRCTMIAFLPEYEERPE